MDFAPPKQWDSFSSSVENQHDAVTIPKSWTSDPLESRLQQAGDKCQGCTRLQNETGVPVDQTQLNYYGPSSDAVTVPQTWAMPVFSTFETFQNIDWVSPIVQQQGLNEQLEYTTVQNQSAVSADNTQLSYYGSTSDTVDSSQSWTFDDWAISTNSPLATCQKVDPVELDLDLLSSANVEQLVDTTKEYTTLQNKPVGTNIPPFVENCGAPMNTNPLPQQLQEGKPELAETTVTASIKVLGYIDEGILYPLVSPPNHKRKSKGRRKKSLMKPRSQWHCKPCERFFMSEPGLTRHNTYAHSGPTPYLCSICGKRFKDCKTMQDHSERHLAKNKPFSCDDCPKKFVHSRDLRQHHDFRHGTARHRCPICGMASVRADRLTDHLRSHQRKKNSSMEEPNN